MLDEKQKKSHEEPTTPMIRRYCQHLSIITAVLYLTLASVATLCVASHEIQHSHVNHHDNNHHAKSNTTHSPLCSWACQVSSKANAADTIHTLFLTLPLLVTGSVFLFLVIPIQANLQLPSPRGPPISVFSPIPTRPF